jgi:hypothetical protein
VKREQTNKKEEDLRRLANRQNENKNLFCNASPHKNARERQTKRMMNILKTIHEKY